MWAFVIVPVAPAATTVEPVPDMVPLFQESVFVTVIFPAPVRVPPPIVSKASVD